MGASHTSELCVHKRAHKCNTCRIWEPDCANRDKSDGIILSMPSWWNSKSLSMLNPTWAGLRWEAWFWFIRAHSVAATVCMLRRHSKSCLWLCCSSTPECLLQWKTHCHSLFHAKSKSILLSESPFHLLYVLITLLSKSQRISHHALKSTWQPSSGLIHWGKHGSTSVFVLLMGSSILL